MENIASEDVSFSRDELTEFTTAFSAIQIHGDRMGIKTGTEAPPQ